MAKDDMCVEGIDGVEEYMCVLPGMRRSTFVRKVTNVQKMRVLFLFEKLGLVSDSRLRVESVVKSKASASKRSGLAIIWCCSFQLFYVILWSCRCNSMLRSFPSSTWICIAFDRNAMVVRGRKPELDLCKLCSGSWLIHAVIFLADAAHHGDCGCKLRSWI